MRRASARPVAPRGRWLHAAAVSAHGGAIVHPAAPRQKQHPTVCVQGRSARPCAETGPPRVAEECDWRRQSDMAPQWPTAGRNSTATRRAELNSVSGSARCLVKRDIPNLSHSVPWYAMSARSSEATEMNVLFANICRIVAKEYDMEGRWPRSRAYMSKTRTATPLRRPGGRPRSANAHQAKSTSLHAPRLQ